MTYTNRLIFFAPAVFLLLLFFGQIAFGQELMEAPRHQEHAFKAWVKDPQTIAQLSIVGTVYAFDGYTSTSGKYNWRNSEKNPILANAGTGKVAAYFGASFAATAGASYLLRRHNLLRWIATGAIAAGETYLVISNHRSNTLANTRCLNNPACSLR